MSLWHLHRGVRTGDQLTLGERAADRMRNGMGSWTFIGAFMLFMAAWMGFNTVALTGQWHFDPMPFILLNLGLSTVAGLQAAALLIAAKRQDAISSEVAIHTEKTADEIKQLLEQNTELTRTVEALTREVHEHLAPGVGSTTTSTGGAATMRAGP